MMAADVTPDEILECQSLIDQWLASNLEKIDLFKACISEEGDERRFIKKSYLELSGYALVATQFGLPIDRRIEEFLKQPDRVALLFSLAAREPLFFSQYGMALAYLAQDERFRSCVKGFISRASILEAADPSELAPQKMLDIAYVLTLLNLKPAIAIRPYAMSIINRWGGIFYMREEHIYFLTHVLFFLNGFGAPGWREPIYKADAALLDKAILACLGRNNLDGAMEVTLARLLSDQPMGPLDESVFLSALAKLLAHQRLDPYLWSAGEANFQQSFHPMIVLAILIKVIIGKNIKLSLLFSSIDLDGLRACAIFGGFSESVGRHDFDKVETAFGLLDGAALRRILPEETLASIRSDFDAVRTFLCAGDGGGFGYFLPERHSGIPVNEDYRRQVGRWFEKVAFHESV